MADSLEPVVTRKPTLSVAAVACALSLCAIAIAWWPRRMASPVTMGVVSRWDKAKVTGILNVGYGGWPPYTIIDPNQSDPARRVSGFSVDLVNEIAKRHSPPLRVQWHQFSWDTMKADLAADRFDFIAEPVFETIQRASDFMFAEPYSYFGIGVAVVRRDETRFVRFADLDRPDITIALAEGWTSSEFARIELSKPTFKSMVVTGDALAQLDEVLLGRADVALNDVPTVLQYVQSHKEKVKALWLDSPPSRVAGAFLLRVGDHDLREFLSASIRVLQADGTITRLDARWKSLGFLPELSLKPGAGIKAIEDK